MNTVEVINGVLGDIHACRGHVVKQLTCEERYMCARAVCVLSEVCLSVCLRVNVLMSTQSAAGELHCL